MSLALKSEISRLPDEEAALVDQRTNGNELNSFDLIDS